MLIFMVKTKYKTLEELRCALALKSRRYYKKNKELHMARVRAWQIKSPKFKAYQIKYNEMRRMERKKNK